MGSFCSSVPRKEWAWCPGFTTGTVGVRLPTSFIFTALSVQPCVFPRGCGAGEQTIPNEGLGKRPVLHCVYLLIPLPKPAHRGTSNVPSTGTTASPPPSRVLPRYSLRLYVTFPTRGSHVPAQAEALAVPRFTVGAAGGTLAGQAAVGAVRGGSAVWRGGREGLRLLLGLSSGADAPPVPAGQRAGLSAREGTERFLPPLPPAARERWRHRAAEHPKVFLLQLSLSLLTPVS